MNSQRLFCTKITVVNVGIKGKKSIIIAVIIRNNDLLFEMENAQIFI